MNKIVSLIVALLSVTSVFSETLPVEEVVNIPATFTEISGKYYDACPGGSDWCLYYENVFGVVYHPETDENGDLVENFYSSHDVVKEIIFHPQSQATTIGYLAFCYLAALESITFPQGITSIDSYAFQGTRNVSTVKVYVTEPSAFCNNQIIGQIKNRLSKSVTLIDSDGDEITEFVIPDGVESIGANAFCNCIGLTSVSIPDGVTSIGASAFYGCTGLTSVTIPASVTSIGSNAFPASTEIWVPKGMKDYYQDLLGPNNKVFEIGTQVNTYNAVIYALDNDSHTAEVVGVNDDSLDEYLLTEQITINGVNYTVTGINGHAFENCQNMTEVNIPQTVTNIGAYAFSGCNNLTSVTIPDGVTGIGAYAFDGCSGLTGVTIPDGVTSIGDYTFNGCSSLTSVTVPDGVTRIGTYAFSDCAGLTSVTFPSSLTSIGTYAFSGCTGLTKVVVPDVGTWSRVSFGNYYANPLVYAHHLYSDENTECTDLVIPDGVTGINSYAFSGCSGLSSVTIPSSVTNIASYAFSGCNGLTTVTMNSNAVMSRYYMNNIFGKQVENYIIGGNVTGIGSYAFEFCTGLKSVTIASSVTSIGNSAFRGCTNLTDVTLSDGLTSLGDYSFNGCASLTSVILPTSVTGIGAYAFENCTGLMSMTIPDGVTSIGSSAFSGCSNLTVKVSVSDMSAFPGNMVVGLIKSVANKPVHLIDNEGIEITEFVIPDGVSTVSDDAFANCVSLTSVTIPPTVTSIGDGAFGGCRGLTTVIIHDGVTNIGSDAFHGCSRLASIYNFNPQPQTIGSSDFSNYNATLYVLDGSVSTYQTADVWNQFNIIGVLKGDVDMDHEVDVADFTLLANYLLGKTQDGFHAPLADVAGSVNGGSDGEIDIADLTGIANIILHGGGASSGAPMKRAPENLQTDIDALDNAIYVEPVTALSGTRQVLSVRMKNSVKVSGFEFALQLPEGITTDDFNMAELSDDRTTAGKTDFFNSSLQADGTLKILCATTRGNRNTGKLYTFSGNEGEVARITIDIPAGYQVGTYNLSILNAKTTDPDGVKTRLPNTGTNINIVSETTGIHDTQFSIDSSDSQSQSWYTLDGQKLDKKPTQKGVYIVNGKKMVVK
ncbi:MAG: leucine-rich repeat protein [Prevotella sp.]|nr:leucine-rich repeat protein [Prevotella sp.]